MRLIDADALLRDWHMGKSCETCSQNTRKCGSDYCFSRMDVCGMIEDAPTVGGWISVKDRKPDGTKGQVLAFVRRDDGGWFRMIAWWSEVHGWISDDPEFDIGMNVTHWMPFPDNPEVEE